MKKIKKILIISFIVILVLSGLIYIDYFIAKTTTTHPKISLKERLDENSVVYKAVLYKVWYCKSNKTYTFGDYNDKDAICPKDYSYVDGFYTNSAQIKISKRDLQLITVEGVYTSDMVENFSSKKQVEDAVHVAYEYGKYKFKETSDKSSDGYKLVLLRDFKEENSNFKWIYDEENLYCLKDDKYLAKYENEKCDNFVKIKMDKSWCENYENSTLVYEDKISDLCKE